MTPSEHDAAASGGLRLGRVADHRHVGEDRVGERHASSAQVATAPGAAVHLEALGVGGDYAGADRRQPDGCSGNRSRTVPGRRTPRTCRSGRRRTRTTPGCGRRPPHPTTRRRRRGRRAVSTNSRVVPLPTAYIERLLSSELPAARHVVSSELDSDVAQGSAVIGVVGATTVVLRDARRALGVDHTGPVDDTVTHDDDPTPVSRGALATGFDEVNTIGAAAVPWASIVDPRRIQSELPAVAASPWMRGTGLYGQP